MFALIENVALNSMGHFKAYHNPAKLDHLQNYWKCPEIIIHKSPTLNLKNLKL